MDFYKPEEIIDRRVEGHGSFKTEIIRVCGHRLGGTHTEGWRGQETVYKKTQIYPAFIFDVVEKKEVAA